MYAENCSRSNLHFLSSRRLQRVTYSYVACVCGSTTRLMYAVVRSTNSRAVLGSYYSQENETGNETSYAAAVPRSYYVCNWVGRTLTLCVTCLTSFTPFLSHYLSLLSLSSWLISQGTWLLTVQPIIYVRNVEPRLLLFSLGMLWGVVFLHHTLLLNCWFRSNAGVWERGDLWIGKS